MENYICKIADLEEINTKWDYEINRSKSDKDNTIKWKKSNVDSFNKGYTIPYYGILNNMIISECTAVLEPSVVQNYDNLVGNQIIYLMGFRTLPEYQGKGYFSKLFNFMINDLRERGYKKVTLGVEAHEIKNKEIYSKYGFTEFIKKAKEVYPGGIEIEVEYYGKDL